MQISSSIAGENLEIYRNRKSYIIILLAMLYVMLNLTCNPLFFRHTLVTVPFIDYTYKSTCSAFIFPLLYILSDIITVLTDKKIATKIVIMGIICDGLSSYFIAATSTANQVDTELVFTQFRTLFLHGILANCLANISEVIIFSFLFNKLKNFFISTNLSIIIILFIHNIITDFYIMRHESDRMSIILHNTISELMIIICYTFLIILFVKILRLKYLLGKKQKNDNKFI